MNWMFSLTSLKKQKLKAFFDNSANSSAVKFFKWCPEAQLVPFLDFQRNRESLISTRMHAQSLSRVWPSATPWTVAHQALLSTEFSRQEYWSGRPFPTPRDLPSPGMKPESLYVPCIGRQILYHCIIQITNEKHLRRWKNKVESIEQLVSGLWSPSSLLADVLLSTWWP